MLWDPLLLTGSLSGSGRLVCHLSVGHWAGAMDLKPLHNGAVLVRLAILQHKGTFCKTTVCSPALAGANTIFCQGFWLDESHSICQSLTCMPWIKKKEKKSWASTGSFIMFQVMGQHMSLGMSMSSLTFALVCCTYRHMELVHGTSSSLLPEREIVSQASAVAHWRSRLF